MTMPAKRKAEVVRRRLAAAEEFIGACEYFGIDTDYAITRVDGYDGWCVIYGVDFHKPISGPHQSPLEAYQSWQKVRSE